MWENGCVFALLFALKIVLYIFHSPRAYLIQGIAPYHSGGFGGGLGAGEGGGFLDVEGWAACA